MTSDLILAKCSQGIRGGHRRGLEYFSQFDETFVDCGSGITIRIRHIFYVNSKFKTLHIRTITQYDKTKKHLCSSY